MFLSDEVPTLETLDFAFFIGSTTPDIVWKCLNTILTSQFHYLDICSQE